MNDRLNTGTFSAGFLDLIDDADIPAFKLDKDLNFIYAGKVFCRTIRCEESLLRGRNIAVFSDRASLQKFHATVQSSDRTAASFNVSGMLFRQPGRDENWVQCDVEFLYVFTKTGQIDGYVCIVSNGGRISTAVPSDNLLKKFNTMYAISVFSGELVHEYNNALTALLGNLSLARMETKDDTELGEILADAESAGQRIKKLTDMLRVFTSGIKPAKDFTDVESLIVGQVKRLLLNYGITCSVIIQEKLPEVELDREMIEEAIYQVLLNAVESACCGETEISIKAVIKEIGTTEHVGNVQIYGGRYILITISDNGPGIMTEIADTLFDPYVTTKSGRSGIGLALARTVLRRHKGFIATGQPGTGGASFNLYIPAGR